MSATTLRPEYTPYQDDLGETRSNPNRIGFLGLGYGRWEPFGGSRPPAKFPVIRG